jgi:hypothetical protein
MEAALEQRAHSLVPDYASFDGWFNAKVTVKDKTLVLPVLRANAANAPASYIDALLDLHRTYRKKLEEANLHRNLADGDYRLLWNKYKLLVHGAEGLSARTKEAFEIKEHRLEAPERLDESLSSCSQTELRARFFGAIVRENDRVALKLLGRLREEAHDPGELEYLEGLCHFHANAFTEAIHRARKVPTDTIDFPAARAIILESLAFLWRFLIGNPSAATMPASASRRSLRLVTSPRTMPSNSRLNDSADIVRFLRCSLISPMERV